MAQATASDRADFTIDQRWDDYSSAEHALWRTLFERQAALLRERACAEFVAGIAALEIAADGIPDFRRLNDALDSLLDGTVVRSRGRLWVADEPEIALHLESAGCGMHVGEGGPREGKTTQIVAITLGEPDAITGAFEGALLTDDELSFVDSIRKLEM